MPNSYIASGTKSVFGTIIAFSPGPIRFFTSSGISSSDNNRPMMTHSDWAVSNTAGHIGKGRHLLRCASGVTSFVIVIFFISKF